MKLLSLRKQKGLTQKDLAEYLGISRQAYANYETGSREPDIATLKQLAEYFDVSLDYLLGKTEKPAENDGPSENVIIYHRDGKTVKREFTKEQMDMLASMIEAIPEKPKDI